MKSNSLQRKTGEKCVCSIIFLCPGFSNYKVCSSLDFKDFSGFFSVENQEDVQHMNKIMIYNFGTQNSTYKRANNFNDEDSNYNNDNEST